MKRRWRLWLALLLLLVTGATLLLPAVHWRLVGWAKGEAIYDGRPTSWWVHDIEDNFVQTVAFEPIFLGGPPPDPGPPIPVDWARKASAPWWEWRPSWWDNSSNLVTQLFRVESAPLVNADPAALPVLLELLRRPEAKSRQVAVTGIARLADYRQPGALAALEGAANDPDLIVRRQVEQELRTTPRRRKE